MRFALLGDHPDGLSAALAFVATGQHELVAVCMADSAQSGLAGADLQPRIVTDIEELFADPDVEVVIVASSLDDRPAHLRRALQSERHVLCVHPADATPDTAYEAGMIQGDTGHILLPLLSGPSHPAIKHLANWLRAPACPIGSLRLIEIEWRVSGPLLAELGPKQNLVALPGWDILRTLLGEVAEIAAFAGGEEIAADQPVPLSGRSETGALFRILFIPHEPRSHLEIRCLGATGRASLTFANGWPAPATFSASNAQSATIQQEVWTTVSPWDGVIAEFEKRSGKPLRPHVAGTPAPPEEKSSMLSWQTETRCLELDDATRRSVERRRAILLEYPEASEEVGFKGTMTLVGCVVLWGILGVFMISLWIPWLQWTIVPILLIFLGMQSFRWLARREPPPIQQAPS
jgi:predicted dehydrogenase